MQDDQQAPAAPQAEAGWQFTGDTAETGTEASVSARPMPPVESVSWTASEFIAHAKSGGWYVILVLITVATVALAYVLTNGELFTPIIIAIVAIMFGVMAARKPRELPYRIDSQGLHIGEKTFSFADFKSFSLVQEEGVESIWLLPLQRYTPGLSIYFAPEDKDRILAILDDFLPVEQRKLDVVDRLMHKIRF